MKLISEREMENLTPWQVMEHLKTKGIVIDEKIAAKILTFMKILAKITIEQYLNLNDHENS